MDGNATGSEISNFFLDGTEGAASPSLAEQRLWLRSADALSVSGLRSHSPAIRKFLLGSYERSELSRVLATVSCEMVTPKQGRPQDGGLFVNLEMSPMADPHYELGRLGEGGIEICRLLERIIKESNCIDTESLCIQSGEKVWDIRVDVHVLDNDGGIIDCASAGALTALIHFRRPDISVVGETVHIHSEDERDPVGLNLYHHPVAVTFGFIDNGRVSVVDPSEKEERVMEGTVVFVMNSRREICALHCSGGLTLNKSLILKCGAQALARAIEITDMIKSEIAKDAEARSKGSVRGFVDDLWEESVRGFHRESPLPMSLEDSEPSTSQQETTINIPDTRTPKLSTNKQTAHLGEGARQMNERESDVEVVEDIRTAMMETTVEDSTLLEKKRRKKKETEDREADDLLGSIEDDIQILDTQENMGYEKKIESPEVIEKIDLTMAIKTKKKKKRTK